MTRTRTAIAAALLGLTAVASACQPAPPAKTCPPPSIVAADGSIHPAPKVAWVNCYGARIPSR